MGYLDFSEAGVSPELAKKQPDQMGKSGSPCSNSIQTCAPTFGRELPAVFETPKGTQGSAKAV